MDSINRTPSLRSSSHGQFKRELVDLAAVDRVHTFLNFISHIKNYSIINIMQYIVSIIVNVKVIYFNFTDIRVYSCFDNNCLKIYKLFFFSNYIILKTMNLF